MTCRLLLAAGVSFLMTVAPASGGTPFGGDDTGFVPPSPPNKRCSEAVHKGTSKLARCLFKCHIKAADSALKGKAFDEELCEQAKCLQKFAAKGAKLIAAGGCPSCLDATGQDAIATQLEGFVDSINGDVYCTPGTPLGGDDPGNVPPDTNTARCQSKMQTNLARFMNCVRLGHKKAARQAFRGDAFNDEALEQACRALYNNAILPCAACLDATAEGDLATQAEQFADDNLGAVYCASPSGAFVGERY